MAHQVELHFHALTDTGLVRTHNEDAVAVLPDIGVALLADGMGGYSAGEVASRIAVEVCTEVLQTGLKDFAWSATSDRGERLVRLVQDAVVRANLAIFEAGQKDVQYAGMGTTLVITLMHHDKLIVAHVGDSRAYRLRDGTLEQITRDHLQVQDQIDAGMISEEQARFATNRNLVTRAMGIDRAVEPDVNQFVTKAGDLYLLCSDGLSDMVEDGEIATILYGAGSTLEGQHTRWQRQYFGDPGAGRRCLPGDAGVAGTDARLGKISFHPPHDKQPSLFAIFCATTFSKYAKILTIFSLKANFWRRLKSNLPSFCQ
jgi:serine/threonine protein phosphatase PrpC